MNKQNDLAIALSEILAWCEPLEQLRINLLKKKDLEEQLARLSFHVAPSYLPFAADGAGIFCVHIWPGRAMLDSPLVHVSTAEQQARFVCGSFRTAPSAIWLWVSTYFIKQPETLRKATSDLTVAIPEAKPAPATLSQFLKEDVVRWSVDPRGNEAWKIADVGHPFAGMPDVDPYGEVEDVLPLLKDFFLSRRNEPEVVAAKLAAQAAIGEPRKREDILIVLGAEAWRELSCLQGDWRESGRGICEWDCTLKHTENPEETFRGTPFEPLIGHPDTYSAEHKEGPKRLLAVADNFHKANDPAGELRQCRNAATLAILTSGKYPLDYAERIATVCDALEKDSLAAAIARESARVHSQGP